MIKKWDFVRDKKKLIEIVKDRDGLWCTMCGLPYGLSLHHIVSRGRCSSDALLVNEQEQLYYRDDPINLSFLCIKCHSFVHKENYNLYLKKPVYAQISNMEAVEQKN